MECPECTSKFTCRQALCDDYANPNKALGCPNCGCFFIKQLDKKRLDEFRMGLVSGGIFVPTAMMIGDGHWLNYVVLFSTLAIMFSDELPFNKVWVKSSYKSP